MNPQPPSLDTWTSIFLLIASQGLFTGIILWVNRRGDKRANRYLATILFLFAITLVEYVLYWSHYLPYFRYFANISLSFPFLFGPLLYFYFRQLLKKQSLNWLDLGHFLPFIIEFAFWLPFYIASPTNRTIFLKSLPQSYQYFVWLRCSHLIVYALLSWQLVNLYAVVPNIKLWGKRIVWFFAAFIATHLSYYFLVGFPFFNPAWDYAISFAMSAFVGLVAVYGYIQPEVFQGLPADFQSILPPLSKKYQNSTLTENAADSLLHRLEAMMANEQLYTDSNLSLDKLSEKLNANKHHLSQVINEKLGVNFFDYINGLRIEAAKTLLTQTDKADMNIIEIAYAVGFNNKVSFNSTFKNRTGMTPTAFRQTKNSKSLSELTS